MTIEEALFAYLTTCQGLASLIGTRLYSLRLPQNPTLPAVTYFKVSRVGERVLGGPNPNTIRARFQFSCWAKSYGVAKSVAGQLKEALQDYSGIMGGPGGVNVLDANPVNEHDFYESDTGLYHIPVDVEILHGGG